MASRKKHKTPYLLTSLPSITERDKNIVTAVYKYRVLTSTQIYQLIFQKNGIGNQGTVNSRCRKRLEILSRYGFLERHSQSGTPSEGRKPYLYFLGELGARLIADLQGKFRQDIDWNPSRNLISQFKLEHYLKTNDVRIAIEQGAEHNGFVIQKWIDDDTLNKKHMKDLVTIKDNRGREKKAAIVPDGYFHMTNAKIGIHCFLEVDLGTMTVRASRYDRRDFANKIRRYLAYYNSGQYEKRYGTKVMRVLTITTSQKRLENLKEVSEKEGGREQFWFTTFQKISPLIITSKAIWKSAGRQNEFSIFSS